MKKILASLCLLSLAPALYAEKTAEGFIGFPIEIVEASALPAVSAPASQALANAQQYARLAADFEKGSAPGLEDLLAWNAGRVFHGDSPEYPGGALLAGWYAPGATLTHAYLKLVVMTVPGSPAFFEKLDPALVPGLKAWLNDEQARWTPPAFDGRGVRFEKVLPSYNKGYSRFEARKTADGRLLLKNSWKTDLGGSVSEGTDYHLLTKKVTPR